MCVCLAARRAHHRLARVQRRLRVCGGLCERLTMTIAAGACRQRGDGQRGRRHDLQSTIQDLAHTRTAAVPAIRRCLARGGTALQQLLVLGVLVVRVQGLSPSLLAVLLGREDHRSQVTVTNDECGPCRVCGNRRFLRVFFFSSCYLLIYCSNFKKE